MKMIDVDRLSFMQEEADESNSDWAQGYNFCLKKVKREILAYLTIESQNEHLKEKNNTPNLNDDPVYKAGGCRCHDCLHWGYPLSGASKDCTEEETHDPSEERVCRLAMYTIPANGFCSGGKSKTSYNYDLY